MTHDTFREVMREFFHNKNDERKETHYLLDGGKLIVPDSTERAFLEKYTAYLQSGGRAYVVSKRSFPTFRMFFDIDAHLTDTPPAGWHEKLGKYILSVAQELFEEADSQTLIICATELKATVKSGQDCVKHGVHVHLPDLHVTKETACLFREAVIQKLCNKMGERPSDNSPTTWRDDIDGAVFEGNGLRLLYSRKLVKCSTCKGRARDGCASCLGTGRIDEGRAYAPLMRVNAAFEVEHICAGTSMLQMLVETSIRSTSTVESHSLRTAAPCWLEVAGVVNDPVKSTRRKRHRSLAHLTEGHRDIESAICDKQAVSPETSAAIKRWIAHQARKGILPKQYANVDVTAFTCVVAGSRSLAFVKLDSCYCSNIGREHNTNTVYLEIDGRTQLCYQKCFCRCDTTEGRRTKYASGHIMKCSEYRSTPCSAQAIQETLFGTVHNFSLLMKKGLFDEM